MKKPWYTSKTVLLGMITTAIGVLAVIDSHYPGLGAVVMIKGVLDIIMRFLTTVPIE